MTDSPLTNAAYTRGGKCCNDCGQPVHYTSKKGFWFHDQQRPTCRIANRIASFWHEHGHR